MVPRKYSNIRGNIAVEHVLSNSLPSTPRRDNGGYDTRVS
jgi:hypothetical protein